MVEVEIVATYKLANINARRLEALIHKFFASSRTLLTVQDRFGRDVSCREWFMVPFNAIDGMVDKITDGSIERFRYDTATAKIVEISN